MYLEDTTQKYQLFSAYQSFLREQILFSPSDQYQEDPRLRIYAVTLQQIVTSNVRIKKNTLIEKKCKFIQAIFLVLNNIILKYLWGRDFLLVQTGPGAHPASCTMGNRSFLGVEASWAWGYPPHPSRVPWS